METIVVISAQIDLDQDQDNYHAGEDVSGAVKIKASRLLEADEVDIRLVGEAKVNWFEMSTLCYSMSGAMTPRPPDNFHQEHQFLNLANQFATDLDSIKLLVNNIQEIPFKFTLPDKDLPSSFKGKDAIISYKIVVNVKYTKHENDCAREIIVLAPIGNHLTKSVSNSVEKDFGIVSLGAGQIVVNASLPRKGYWPGEIIELFCDIYNESSLKATPRAVLYQTQINMCGEHHKAWQLAISERVVGECVANESNVLQVLRIPLPSDVNLSIRSKLISVKYWIHLVLDIPHAFDIHMNLPIVVTTKSAINKED